MRKWLPAFTSLGVLIGLALWELEASGEADHQDEKDYWSATIPDIPNEELFAVFENEPLPYQTLKIGVGNFFVEDYVTDAGETVTGMRCGVSVYVLNDPQEYMLRVYPGQPIIGDGYLIRMHSMVRHENNRWSLQLGISKVG